jgi:tRNA(Ile)-lysidine synthase
MIDDAKLTDLFLPIATREDVAVAVSGGPDSMALLHLADRWRRQRLERRQAVPNFTILTVNHGLRPEAADECRLATAAAERLGYPSQLLAWPGERPQTGLQEWARELRYQLLATACHARGLGVLMTGHHLDDQAETFLMRLSRGSGVDGLSAMAPESRRLGLTLLRPLLDVPKRMLVGELEQHGIAYAKDPSNADPRYERARLRQREGELKKLGLSAEMIGLSSKRLRQARHALEETRDTFLARNAQISPYGSARVDQLALSDAPFDIAVRALARILRICGGGREAPNLARLETLTENLRADFDTGRTLAGCRLIAKAESWLVVREASRISEIEKKLMPGQCVFWDNRYVVCLDAAAPRDILAGPLGRAVDIDQAIGHAPPKSVPKEALASLLTLRRKGEIIAVPALDMWSEEAVKAGLTARFIGGDEGVG